MTTVVNKNTEPFDIYIGRGSKWGNPFSHKAGTRAKHIVKTREEAIAKFKEWITQGEGRYLLRSLPELKNKRLGCFCKPLACHGDVLAELVDSIECAHTNLIPLDHTAIKCADCGAISYHRDSGGAGQPINRVWSK